MVIRFTDLCLISSIILISAAVNVLTTDRFDIHRLLYKPIEQLTMIPKGSMAPNNPHIVVRSANRITIKSYLLQ